MKMRRKSKNNSFGACPGLIAPPTKYCAELVDRLAAYKAQKRRRSGATARFCNAVFHQDICQGGARFSRWNNIYAKNEVFAKKSNLCTIIMAQLSIFLHFSPKNYHNWTGKGLKTNENRTQIDFFCKNSENCVNEGYDSHFPGCFALSKSNVVVI